MGCGTVLAASCVCLTWESFGNLHDHQILMRKYPKRVSRECLLPPSVVNICAERGLESRLKKCRPNSVLQHRILNNCRR